jgi:hypothetical protein
MRYRDPVVVAELEELVRACVPSYERLTPPDQERLRQMAAELQERRMPVPFIASSLRSTADLLREMHDEEEAADNVLQREHVRSFIEQNAVPTHSARFQPRREAKRNERERLYQFATNLLREARQSRARHEVKKTRNMLLKLDQRELRRVLGRDGDDLCRQINTWLRSAATMFQ